MKSIICVAVAALALPAKAATITVQTIHGGDPVVLIDGHFEENDFIEFYAKTSDLDNALVVFRGDGGDGGAAIDIGRTIKARGFATAVADTCYASCAIAWLGGIKRFMGAKAQIGFCRLPVPKTARESLVGNDSNAEYAAEMDLRPSAVEWMTAKGPDELSILTKAEADRLGIEVDIYDAKAAAGPQGGAR